MKNVFDIRKDENLFYVLSKKYFDNYQIHPFKGIVIIIYLFYEDTLNEYYDYINSIPKDIEIVMITSNQSVMHILKEKYSDRGNCSFVLKRNCGRDISALLIEAKPYIMNAQYICFVHDKKEHLNERRTNEMILWRKSIWENTIASEQYISNVISTFDADDSIGLLSIPEPIGKYYNTWEGFAWHGSYEATVQTVEQLNLNCAIDREHPPVSVGTAFWARKAAISKIINYCWTYSDFDDSRLSDDNYLSYAIERIFPYVVQDAGYKTGTIMNEEYAARFINLAQQICMGYSLSMENIVGIRSAHNCECLVNNYKQLIDNIGEHSRVYLYGAGIYGVACIRLLRMNRIEPVCVFVSSEIKKESVEGVPVYIFDENKAKTDNSIIVITISDENDRNSVLSKLERTGIDVCCFWNES